MKAQVVIDTVAQTVEFHGYFNSREEAAKAMDALMNAAHTLWPDLVLQEEDAPWVAVARGHPTAAQTRQKDYSQQPKPGTLSDKVLHLLKRDGYIADAKIIANALGVKPSGVGAVLRQLKDGGHL